MPNEEQAESLAAESPDPGASEPQGETPEQPEGTESATVEASESTTEADESVSAPEAARRSDRSNAETRIKQLTARNKALERRLAEGQKPAPKPAETQAKLTEPVKPSFANFDSIEEYEAARDGYEEKLRAYAVDKDRSEREAARVAEERTKNEQKALETWNKRAVETAKRNPDFNTRDAMEVVAPTDVMDGFFVDSEIGPDILNHLHQNPDEAERIRGLTPYKAVRELVLLESTLSDQIKGTKAKTAPPKPPKLVDGAGTSPAKAKSLEEVFYG